MAENSLNIADKKSGVTLNFQDADHTKIWIDAIEKVKNSSKTPSSPQKK